MSAADTCPADTGSRHWGAGHWIDAIRAGSHSSRQRGILLLLRSLGLHLAAECLHVVVGRVLHEWLRWPAFRARFYGLFPPTAQNTGHDQDPGSPEVNQHFQVLLEHPLRHRNLVLKQRLWGRGGGRNRGAGTVVELIWHCRLPLSFKVHALFADLDVTLVHHLGDDVRAFAEIVIDEVRLAVFHLVHAEFLRRTGFDVGEFVVVIDGLDVEGVIVALHFVDSSRIRASWDRHFYRHPPPLRLRSTRCSEAR